MKKNLSLAFLVAAAFFAANETQAQLCPAAGAGGKPVVVLPTRIQANMVLSLGTDYVMDGKVFVENNATLFIENGVTVFGVKKTDNNLSSALIITKAGKVQANGTPEAPIVFRGCPTTPANGDWGGIVMLGNASINQPSNQVIEGINTDNVPVGVDVTYGLQNDATNDNTHNSGVLNYVRIEYAGAAVSANNELNGLTMGGVGRATFLDFIETYYGADDGFEWFGGCVNAKHLIAFTPDDDCFDTDFGFTGGVQFGITIRNPSKTTYSSDPRGFECDNDAGGSSLLPRSKPQFSNMTIIGMATQALATGTTPALQSGAHFRRNTDQVTKNSIFMGYPTGVTFDAGGAPGSPASIGNFQYNLVHAYTTLSVGATPDVTTQTFLGTPLNANTDIKLVDPFNPTFPDFRPQSDPASPALTGANFSSGLTALNADGSPFFQTVTYRGAFSGSINWNATWSRFGNIGSRVATTPTTPTTTPGK